MSLLSRMSEFFDKKSERKTLANSVFKNGELDDICHMMSRKMVDVNNPNIAQFHQSFIYGKKMNILHRGKKKEMFVYLDHQRDKLLWISSKSKAFLVDLYFTTAFFKQQSEIQKIENMGNKLYYFSLRYLDDETIFIFDNEEEQNRYLNLFKIYSDQLKKVDPNYFIYFSYIAKMLSMRSTENGSNQHTKSQILEISEKVGLNDTKLNLEILRACLDEFGMKNMKQIPLQCVDYYFYVRFCNIRLQTIYEDFSKQKIGKINENPRVIFHKSMSLLNFVQFLKQCQKENQQRINKILELYKNDLSFFEFCKFIYDSNLNNASRVEDINTSYPLNDYYCYSSHNTYLSGNQLSSDSKVERYEEDLHNGVKCVELDVHNDGVKPIVTHAFKGAGFCKPVDFQNVIKIISTCSAKSIRQHKSHFPFVLSIQNHASAQNRQQMLDIMTRYFGKDLFYLEGKETTFPTLEQLKGKILIKTSSNENEVFSFKKKVLVKKKSNAIDSVNFLVLEKKNYEKFENNKLQQRYDNFVKFKNQFQSKKQQFNARIAQFQQIFIPISSMAKVTSIFKSVQGINNPKPSNFICTSITYTKAMSLDQQQIIKYTSTSWLRIFPIGTQVNSDNYNPAPMLRIGAQIIALNTQTKDDFGWMAYAYFCGGHITHLSQRGYILKPEHLRRPELLKQTKKEVHFLTITIIESSGYDVIMTFKGLDQDIQRNKIPSSKFGFYNPEESFIIFDFGDKYRNCVAVKFIAEGYRIIEGKNRYNYLDCGVRVLIHVHHQVASV